MSERISLRLPVAGEVFFLDIPLYRTMLHGLWLPEITIRQGQVCADSTGQSRDEKAESYNMRLAAKHRVEESHG